jgi:hypothetical protein
MSKEQSIVVSNVFKLLSQMNTRLTVVEERLNNLDTRQTLMDEERIPAGIGHLGGKTLTTTSLGGIKTDKYLPFCDKCGVRCQEEDFVLCYSCRRKVCKQCLIKNGTTFLCIDCLQDLNPLNKKEFKVLYVINKGTSTKREIAKITNIPIDDVSSTVSNLLTRKLILKKGISILSTLQMTDDGMETYGLYATIYETDEDIKQLFEKLEPDRNEYETSWTSKTLWAK